MTERAIDDMSPEEWTAYMRGGWAALSDVLSLLQTFETRSISKNDLFQAIMEMRPRVPSVAEIDS